MTVESVEQTILRFIDSMLSEAREADRQRAMEMLGGARPSGRLTVELDVEAVTAVLRYMRAHVSRLSTNEDWRQLFRVAEAWSVRQHRDARMTPEASDDDGGGDADTTP